MSFDHPAFAPYRQLIDTLDLVHAPATLAGFNAVAGAFDILQARGLPLRFIAAAGRLSARDYETHILQTGQVPTRADTWHDVMNALVWLRFPHFKAALNAAHGEAIDRETDTLRGRRRDALTVLDESGVWVNGRDSALHALLAEHAWQALFWEHRHAVETTMQFVVVGHALLEKLLAPYPAVTGKCLMLNVDSSDPGSLELQAVATLSAIDSPRQLAPLPVQGVPGWDAANATTEYYANQAIFRPPRLNLPSAANRPLPPTPAPSPDHQTGESQPT